MIKTIIKKTIMFVITIITLNMMSCDMEDFEYVNISNLSKDSVYIYMATSYYVDYFTAYPDTLMPPSDSVYMGYKFGEWLPLPKFKPGEAGSVLDVKVKNLSSFFYEVLPKDTFSVFFISCDTLNKYGHDVVAKENKILVRYDLSIPDLERMNYNIPYPPAPWMKEMKMYPSYDRVVNRYK